MSTLVSPATTTSAVRAAAARRSAGAESVVMMMLLACSGAAATSALSRSRSRVRVTTAIGADGARPFRSHAQRSPSDSGRTGAYRSVRAVPAPTRITSASARSMAKICRSHSLDRPRERPPRVAAPSRLSTMFPLTQCARPPARSG